ncbi:hypothetical protein M422DRAFT_266690 [Sphaerobolus stellatus SS14]|uniref:Uncharacterized protein n=1 Tax=Sphaerobolus stellatus (strain SS14) TaxID=990650 RepID=A0A0C9TNP6_SPHS4|nr:hypothetical protein M422DRAFT_266690 [Sphaerobolus stellatus SS14]
MSTRSGNSYGKPRSRRSMSVGAPPPSYNLTTLTEFSGVLRNIDGNAMRSEGNIGEGVQDIGEGMEKDDEYNSITRSASPTQGSIAKIPPSITSRDVDMIPPVVDGMRSIINYKIPVKVGPNVKNTNIPPPAAVVEVGTKNPIIDGEIQHYKPIHSANTRTGQLDTSYANIVSIHRAKTDHIIIPEKHSELAIDDGLKTQGGVTSTTYTQNAEKQNMDNDAYIQVQGKKHHRKPKRKTQIKTSGSRYFNAAFESSENDSANSNGEEEPIRTSIPSTSIPTTQGRQPVDANYRKFTEGILSELPIEEQTRILG